LLDGFPALSPDTMSDKNAWDIGIGKDSQSGGLLYSFISFDECLLCIGSVQESKFRSKLKSVILLSKAMELSAVDPNIPEYFYSDQRTPWHTEFVTGKDMRDAQAKVASVLAVRNPRHRAWAVCMQVFGKELYATVFQKIDDKKDSKIAYSAQEHIGELALVCPPVQVCLFWRE
jgi:exopolysaccharide biosynthesis protein